MKLSDAITALEGAMEECGDVTLYFEHGSSDNLVLDTFDIGKEDMDEDEDVLVVQLTPDAV